MPAKRTKKSKALPKPDYEAGLRYCEPAGADAIADCAGTALEPTVDTVLGGFGTGSLPRVDALRCALLRHAVLPRYGGHSDIRWVPIAYWPCDSPVPPLVSVQR